MNYIPQSEYLRGQTPEDPLVCSECGARQNVQCCSLIHTDRELRRTDPNYSGFLGMTCSCPRCSPTVLISDYYVERR